MKIYAEWYGKGHCREARPGETFRWSGPVGSLKVEPHERVCVYAGADDDGRAPFHYAGWYPEFKFYGPWTQGPGLRLVKVEKSDPAPDALVRLSGWKRWSNGRYRVDFHLPPGEFADCSRYFVNDFLEEIELRCDGQLEMYEHGSFGGRAWPYTARGVHELGPSGAARQVSSLRWTLDGWTERGVEFGAPRNKRKIGEAVAFQGTLAIDPSSPADEVTDATTIGHSEAATYEFHWSVTAGITVSASVKASTGALPGGEVTAGVSASLEAQTGQSRSVTATQDLSKTLEVKGSPGDVIRYDLLVEHFIADVPVRQTLVNDRTGLSSTREGVVHCRYSESQARVR